MLLKAIYMSAATISEMSREVSMTLVVSWYNKVEKLICYTITCHYIHLIIYHANSIIIEK